MRHPVWILASWVYIAIAGFLAIWVGLAMLLVGLRPVVVTSGSMSPALRPGDVVLVADHVDEVALGSIVTFDVGQGSVTHRVVELTDAGYRTKGDSNPAVDASTVSSAEVTGVGRLVVPFVGLPAMWLRVGNWGSFLLWAMVTVGVVMTASMRGERHERRRLKEVAGTSARLSAPGLRRVRLLAMALLIGQYVANPAIFDTGASLTGAALVGAIAAGMLAVNATSMFGEEKVGASRLALIEIGIDTILVLSLILALEDAAITWIVLAVPLIGAVTRFRMIGALQLWGVLAIVLMGADMLAMPSGSQEVVPAILGLRETVERLGIVLVVLVPGGYLLEQLLVEVERQREAADDAARTSGLLRTVLAESRELNRLGQFGL